MFQMQGPNAPQQLKQANFHQSAPVHDQFQQSMNSVQSTVQGKTKGSRSSFNSPLPSMKTSSPFSSSSSTSGVSSMSSINSALDNTLADDITQLSNSVSNLSATQNQNMNNGNHQTANGLFPHQVSLKIYPLILFALIFFVAGWRWVVIILYNLC